MSIKVALHEAPDLTKLSCIKILLEECNQPCLVHLSISSSLPWFALPIAATCLTIFEVTMFLKETSVAHNIGAVIDVLWVVEFEVRINSADNIKLKVMIMPKKVIQRVSRSILRALVFSSPMAACSSASSALRESRRDGRL